VRELPFYLNPQAEHLIDWFHITMRLTVMGQMAKGLGGDTAVEVAEGILAQEFEPTPSLAACSACDYRLICPAAEI